MRASPSTAASVAPTVTWNPPSTGYNGTWSRTASARTSWTTGCWKMWMAPSRSSGMAAIRTWKPNAELTPQRRGERLFFDARFAFHGGFSCANCHLESTFDGLQWDLEPDGFGKDIVDNRLSTMSLPKP